MVGSTPTRLRHILFTLGHLTSARGNMREHFDPFMFLLAAKAEQACCSLFADARYSPGIDVHRRADVRMTKQFLLYLDVCAVLVEQTRIGVPKCMPTKSPCSDLFSSPQQPATLCAPRVRGLPRTFAREYPLALLKRGGKP